jgi:hypothetical protein
MQHVKKKRLYREKYAISVRRSCTTEKSALRQKRYREVKVDEQERAIDE